MNECLALSKNGAKLGGEDFYIASGDMHYFRFFKGGWERRLRLMKEFGLTCVQTYVPWNLHEPEKGKFCFEDYLDIGAFLQTCQKAGLKVLLRPSPYICSEWDFGGLPAWLWSEKTLAVRTHGESYMKHVRSYTERLCKEFVPYLSTNGGPVIAVGVENEYGSYGNDKEYIRQTAQLLRDNGVDVPLYTSDGDLDRMLANGRCEGVWAGINVAGVTDSGAGLFDKYNDNKPRMVVEEWSGRCQQWGKWFDRQSPKEAAAQYKKGLDAGFFINLYMFCGGTNYGFMSGANFTRFSDESPDAKHRYIPFATSYDTDAPVNEDGRPTEKYYAMKKVLCDYLGTPYEENKCGHIIGKPDSVTLAECGSLFSNLDALTENKEYHENVIPMEEMGGKSGFIMYSTHLDRVDDLDRRIKIEGLADRATIYVNGTYVGSILRERENDVRFSIPDGGANVDILVENMGRINYGYNLAFDRKGISKCVRFESIEKDGTAGYDFSMALGFTIRTIPLSDISNIKYDKNTFEPDKPTFYKGNFKAEAGVDTYLDMAGHKKGMVWVNGFNLGRFWEIGPQETLYVPGELLKEENDIVVFEIYGQSVAIDIDFSKEQKIDSITENFERF